MQHLNFSQKFEVSSSINEGEDRFLVIFENSEINDLKIFAVHMFVLETFYKNYNILKAKQD